MEGSESDVLLGQDYVLFYAKKDRDMAFSLQLTLNDVGIRGCLYDQDPGAELENVPDLLLNCRWILFFITENFIPEETLQLHKNEALLLTLRRNQARLIPIYSPDQHVLLNMEQNGLSSLILIEGVNMVEDHALPRLIHALRQSPPPHYNLDV